MLYDNFSSFVFAYWNKKNLTSFFHVTLEAVGLEVMLHSKYTSSPSLISDASKFEPKDNPTTGGSVENNRNR